MMPASASQLQHGPAVGRATPARAFLAILRRDIFVAGKEFGTRYAKDNGLLPNYPDALTAYADDPVNAPFAKTFAVAKGFPADPQWAEANDTKAVLQNAAREVIQGKKSVDQALSDANKELESILNTQ